MSVGLYDPQRPSSPGDFAGRQRLVDWVTNALGAARQARRSSAVLVHGHRGSGKTSALRKIQALAVRQVPGSLIVEIPLRESSSAGGLLAAIVEEMQSAARRREASSSRWRRAARRLAGVQVSAAGIGVGVAFAPKPTEEGLPIGAFREALDAVASAPLLLICIDDAEQLDPAGLGTLKTIAEASTPLPILLAVGAGPEFLRRLATHEFSPVARAFSGAVFDMDSFGPEETRQALRNPLREAGARSNWGEGAIDLVQRLTHGYPYLVKCLAAAAYRPGGPIDAAVVEAAVPRALELAGPWLEHEVEEASDGDIRAFVTLVESGRSDWRTGAILQLGVNSVYITRLARLGVLRKLGPGHYELARAPAIAYYRELKRRSRDKGAADAA